MQPQVSIVIPTHNRPALVRRAVGSVLAQTLSSWEAIIVDDGSAEAVTPDTLGTQDPRVKIIRHADGRGVSAARNAGIAAAQGAWVAFLDDDDYWAREKLAVQLRAAAAYDAGFVFTSVLMVDEQGRLVYGRGTGRHRDLTRALVSHNAVGEPSSVIVRRDALDAVGPFTDELSMLADWDMWFRLSRVTTCHGISPMLTAITMHPGNMQIVDIERAEAELATMTRRHAEALAQLGTSAFGSAWTDLWLAEKRRKASPTMRSFTAHVRAMYRAHGVLGATDRLARRGVAELRGRPLPPGWARQPVS